VTTTPTWPAFNRTEDGLDTLVKLSRHYGQTPGFVIAGGGNTSYKTAGKLFVKASGTQLSTITRDGFVVLDRAQLAALADTRLPADPTAREAQFKDAILKARYEPEKGQRPSVESLLHHLLPAQFVVHSHATIVNTFTCSTQGEKIARELFGDDFLWIPFVDPGYVLGRLLKDLLVTYKAATGRAYPKIILMANHGLIVSGDTPDEIKATTDALLTKISARLGDNWRHEAFGPLTIRAADPVALVNTLAPALRALAAEGDHLKVVTFDDSPLVAAFTCTEAAKKLPFDGPLNPDQIVYCNSYPLYFAPEAGTTTDALIESLRAALAAFKQTYNYQPRVILVRGLGLFATGDDYKSAATARPL